MWYFQRKIGGVNKIIEIDETCWVKQKHHRGVPKKGTQQWYVDLVCFMKIEKFRYFGCIERREGGQAIVERVKDRKTKTLFKLIKRWVRPGTTIISDKWLAIFSLNVECRNTSSFILLLFLN